MGAKGDTMDLSGELLVAMPGLGDTRFARSVILICAHSEDGAMGLVVNRPARDLNFADLLAQLGIEGGEGGGGGALPIHFGGPVETARGFVLHSPDYPASPATLQVGARFAMTATLDVLEDIAHGRGPASAMLALGYSGWGPGQLEAEILDNGWLTCEASDEIVFGAADANKWRRAIESLGIGPAGLSAAAGHA